MSTERLEHTERVAEMVAQWADRLLIPENERNRWLRAVWLHDALRDAPLDEVTRLASATPLPPSLLHGPASAAQAKAEGETDRGVLDAVRYHSVGLAEWDMVGRMLYCADYLEPGRPFDRERRAELAAQLPEDPSGVLREVAKARVARIISKQWPIPEPTWRFWNSLFSPKP